MILPYVPVVYLHGVSASGSVMSCFFFLSNKSSAPPLKENIVLDVMNGHYYGFGNCVILQTKY